MQNTNSVHSLTLWKRLIWIIILCTILLTIAITLVFQRNVSRIDREFEKARTHETR